MMGVGGSKSLGIILVLVLLLSLSAALAESVDLAQVRDATDGFLKGRSAQPAQGPSGSIRALATGRTPVGFREVRDDDGTVVAYVADLEPRGFIALSADTDITPVIAYSFRASFPAVHDTANPLYRLLRADMKLRARALAERPELKTQETALQWDFLADGRIGIAEDGPFQQWPAEGTTSMGGWVQTAWGQDEPYNAFCPRDPSDSLRSYVGCVATAFAQVVHYHRLCELTLDEDDSYTTYSGMKIDADGDLYDFASFTELNGYLDRIRAKYSQGADLNDVDIAALSSACGVAVQMDYSSDGSGASLYAAREALVNRLGYHSADMFGALTGAGLVALQENMIDGLPALLSFSPPDGWGGHVVVCDGYNTDGEYHLNFGWGAADPQKITEAWYRLPTAFLYRDCVITETILNIQSVEPIVEVDAISLSFSAAPGEQSEPQILRIRNNAANLNIESISCPDGFLLDREGQGYANHLGSFTIGPLRQEVSVNVVFKPGQAGSYYGALVIRYGNGSTRSVILKGYAYDSGTTIAAGQVSGTWSLDKSPYFVTGSIRVPAGGQLVIEPGVKVFFMGSCGLTAGQSARLAAQGNEAQPIEFTAWNREAGWGGLRFVNSGHDDVLSHCVIQYARKEAGLDPRNGSAMAAEADALGGAIYCAASHPVIENCRITNNAGERAGAIYCTASSPLISNTLIANNTAVGGDLHCGGICGVEAGTPEIRNCTIVNNFPGGLFTSSWDGMNVTNTILWGNDRYQIYTNESVPTVAFCDVQGGYPGEGNFDMDPCFLNPSGGVGTGYDGASANWTLRTNSPCINSGTQIDDLPSTDLAGAERIHSGVTDVGAYENQSDLPLMTATPSTPVDAGFVAVNANATVTVRLTNTGELGFEIVDTSVVRGTFSIEAPVRNRLLAPGESVEVEIGFRPTRERVYTDTLLVRSTSSNAPVMQIALRGVGITGAAVPAGTVSGIWKKASSPYTVTGDIRVARNQTLTIEPGVVVKFAGHFGLTVGYQATLRAVGTEQDRITFTPISTDEGWFGIRFINSATEDQLKYCTIEYAAKPRTGGGSFENLYGGAILCYGSWEDDPGTPVVTGPTIDSCLIARNYARSGGGIMCYDGGNAIITNNVIIDNYADMDGAGIALYAADCTISNNVIARNYALVGGGIMNWMSAPSIRNNTIVDNKPSAMHLERALSSGERPATVSIVNNIIWQNEIWLYEDAEADEYDIRYNDIQGGWAGTGNIAVDPLFADAEHGDYHLKSQAGRWDPAGKGWVLDSVTSPCIDAGDPAANFANEPQPSGHGVDLGAYGGTEQASKSPPDANGP